MIIIIYARQLLRVVMQGTSVCLFKTHKTEWRRKSEQMNTKQKKKENQLNNCYSHAEMGFEGCWAC